MFEPGEEGTETPNLQFDFRDLDCFLIFWRAFCTSAFLRNTMDVIGNEVEGIERASYWVCSLRVAQYLSVLFLSKLAEWIFYAQGPFGAISGPEYIPLFQSQTCFTVARP